MPNYKKEFAQKLGVNLNSYQNKNSLFYERN